MMLRYAVLIAGLLAAGSAGAAQTRFALGVPPIAELEAAFVAKDEGLFQRQGLEVEFLPTGSNQTLVASLVAGSHQIVAVSPTVLLQAVDSGIDLVVIANGAVTAMRTAKNIGLAVRGGVDIDQPQQLIGKKLGTPSIGGTLDVLFRQWMKQKDVARKSVTFIEVPIPNTADVLKGGTVDAVIIGEPVLRRAVSLSNGKVAFHFMADLPEGLPYTTFVATRQWAQANPAIVQAFRKAIAEAAEFVMAQPQRTRDIISKYTRVPVEVLNSIELPECRPVPEQAPFDYFQAAMREAGLLKTTIDTAGLIAP